MARDSLIVAAMVILGAYVASSVGGMVLTAQRGDSLLMVGLIVGLLLLIFLLGWVLYRGDQSQQTG